MIELEDDIIILHDLREVNLTVGFFLDTEKELYSICWADVDVRVELVTVSEQIHELPFTSNTQQLFIGDQKMSGEVFDFYCKKTESGIMSYCKLIIRWN